MHAGTQERSTPMPPRRRNRSSSSQAAAEPAAAVAEQEAEPEPEEGTEPMAADTAVQDETEQQTDGQAPSEGTESAPEPEKKRGGGLWDPEKKKAFSEKMRARYAEGGDLQGKPHTDEVKERLRLIMRRKYPEKYNWDGTPKTAASNGTVTPTPEPAAEEATEEA